MGLGTLLTLMNSYDIVEKTVGVCNAEAGKIGRTRHLASCHGLRDRAEKKLGKSESLVRA